MPNRGPAPNIKWMQERFRDRLRREWAQRRAANPRFSLRAFALLLGTDHSTLSQILRQQRGVPLSRLRTWARRLGLDPEETATYVAAEHLPDPETTARQSQLRHWTAEAAALLTSRLHWQLYDLCRSTAGPPDCRRIATQLGASVDELNVALTRLLRLRMLESDDAGRWLPTSRPPLETERDFRHEALARVRRKAAESQVHLPATLRA